MYLLGSMPCVSIMTSPSEDGEEDEGWESFHRPRRALNITPPPPAPTPPLLVVVEGELLLLWELVGVKGGRFSLVRW